MRSSSGCDDVSRTAGDTGDDAGLDDGGLPGGRDLAAAAFVGRSFSTGQHQDGEDPIVACEVLFAKDVFAGQESVGRHVEGVDETGSFAESL